RDPRPDSHGDGYARHQHGANVRAGIPDMTYTLTLEIAENFTNIALAHVGREYPNKMDHVIGGPDDLVGPRAAHPIFFGSFDWHSCVHGYWLMARLLRRYPQLSAARKVSALFEEQVTKENVSAEVAYLARPGARGFERPYGWGWLLALQAELELHEGD